jgi:hypothetical protein
VVNLHDPLHPVWSLLRLTVLMVALTVILALVAEKFDKTEIIAIVGTFTAGTAGIGLEGYNRAKGKSD